MKITRSKVFVTTLVAGAVSTVIAQAPLTNKNPAFSSELTTTKVQPNSQKRYILTFKENTAYSSKTTQGKFELNKSLARNLIESKGGAVKRLLVPQNAVAATLSDSALSALMVSGALASYEIDPRRQLMAESTPYGIGMVQADQVSDALTGNRKICITDTGYDVNHEDLISNGVTGDANDGNGNDTGNWYNDGHGHGTHVAGTISAIGGNSKGVVGVNPSGLLGLHIVKVFNDAGSWGYGSDMVAAVNQCRAAGANVISMSLGGSGSSSTEQAAFDDALSAGVLSIAAAGNGGNSSLSYPASYNSVMSVAAVNSSGSVASFSQFNSQVEIAAPGVSVNSTLPGNSYASWDGTSMATPHVAGVAALVWSHYTNCSAAQIRSALNATAEDRGSSGRDNYYGWGIVKAKAAFDYLSTGCDGGGTPPPPPPPPPPTGGELTNGVAVSNLSGATGSESFYTLEVPAGSTNLSFNLSGGTGDADMYVRFGTQPTTGSYDCRPYLNGNNETCAISNIQAGTYHVMLRGYSAFSGTSLVGSYDEAGSGTGGTFSQSNLSGSRRSWKHYSVEIPAGMGSFTVNMSGGSGDADMYVRKGSQPTTSKYDCRPYANGNTENCSFNNPGAATWYISVRGYSSYSGVNINAEWKP